MARALIVGVDKYDQIPPLTGCVNDAHAMKDVLEWHEDGSSNYACHLYTSPGRNNITRKFLREQWSKLFDNYKEDILFYFSGHGHPTEVGGYIVTQDAEPGEPGLNMDELLTRANNSEARSVLLILDCCFAGKLGDTIGGYGGGRAANLAILREGLTILAASRPLQTAGESAGRGVFTTLVVDALRGGAADIRGRVSSSAIYAHIEEALGPWDQKAAYKSHAYMLPPVRQCKPSVDDALLRWLPTIFDNANDAYQMDPSFELTHPSAKSANVEIFNRFKVLRNARLLTTEGDKDLYYVSLESKAVQLTPLGRFYWRLAKKNNLR